MARILAVGNATLDIINILDHYPREDEEVRAEAQRITRGGNATNTLVVLAQLGHHCSWAGTLADEPDAQAIRDELLRYAIDTTAVHTHPHGKVPTSYITLNSNNGSRTIVHYRDLPEFKFADFQRINLLKYDWVHFEGRNIEEVDKMLRHIHHASPELRISLEIEKHRPEIERLFPYAHVLMFGRDYAHHLGYDKHDAFIAHLRRLQLPAKVACTWGEQGAYGFDGGGDTLHAPAQVPATVIDTLGAGDAFNAGLIDALIQRTEFSAALRRATALAGRKCGLSGLHGLG